MQARKVTPVETAARLRSVNHSRGDEEEHGRLEGGGDADQYAADPVGVGAAYGEAAQQDEEDRDDAGLAEPQGVAHRQGQHQQADRDRRREQRRAAAHRLRQRPGGHQAEGDDEQQRAEGPPPAEGLLGGAGEGFEDQADERGAGELRGLVQRALHVQDAVLPDPRLQVRQPLPARGAEDRGQLPDGEDGGDQPQSEAGDAQPCPGRIDGRGSESLRRSPTVFRIRHAPSASRPVRIAPVRAMCRPCEPYEARTTPGGRRRQPPLNLTAARFSPCFSPARVSAASGRLFGTAFERR